MAGHSYTERDGKRLRLDIIEVMRRLYLRGMNSTFSGNVSVKVGRKTMLITPSQVDKFSMSPKDITFFDFVKGRAVSGPEQSTEWKMHAYVYEACRHVNAIVHPHPQISLAFVETRGLETLGLRNDEESAYYIGRVGEVGKLPFGSAELAEAVANQVSENDADVVLLKGHGTVGVGNTLYQALDRVEALEHIAKKRAFSYLLE